MEINVGVLALQGDVSEHISAFERAIASFGPGVQSTVAEVRKPEEIPSLDALAIPGGESTTISRLIDQNHMRREVEEFEGGIFATCAGMVLMATGTDDERVRPLGLIDIRVERNAFGRQRESFEADISVEGLNDPFHAIFIRAPLVTRTGSGVDVLARIDRGIVGVRNGRHFAMSFHPELGGDPRIHSMFLRSLFR